MNKASKDYIKLAEAHGFVLVRCKKHVVFKHKNGAILTCSSSPSDSRRGLMNLKRDIKKVLSRNNRVLQSND